LFSLSLGISVSCSVPPAQCLLLSASCSKPPAQCLPLSAFSSVPPAQCLLLNAFCSVPSAQCLLLGIYFLRGNVSWISGKGLICNIINSSIKTMFSGKVNVLCEFKCFLPNINICNCQSPFEYIWRGTWTTVSKL
jgi:hypothetical protein